MLSMTIVAVTVPQLEALFNRWAALTHIEDQFAGGARTAFWIAAPPRPISVGALPEESYRALVPVDGDATRNHATLLTVGYPPALTIAYQDAASRPAIVNAAPRLSHRQS